MTTILTLSTTTQNYNVVIGQHLLRNLPQVLADQGIHAEQVAIVTDENVGQFRYCNDIQQAFSGMGVATSRFVIRAGDTHKSLATAEQLYHQLLEVKFRRSGLIVAVGGGVVGDVAGFVAATYQRGVRYVQVPTTLLAHDSSIGGKVGVNMSEAKNLVGAFHQPAAVVMDTTVLRTLPVREWRGGMAEVIKHGIIGNHALFNSLAQTPYVEMPSDSLVEQMLADAMQVKIDIVGRDEFDRGERMKLNVGHTVGHAIEQASEYQLNHGEAVSIGIALESQIAARKGWLEPQVSDQITAILQSHQLPTSPPELPFNRVMDVLKLDKKHGRTTWTFAVPFQIGDVRIVHDVSEQDVADLWSAKGR